MYEDFGGNSVGLLFVYQSLLEVLEQFEKPNVAHASEMQHQCAGC